MTMLRATQGDSNQPIPVRGMTLDAVVTSRKGGMRGGLAGSLGLHLLLLAAILAWPFLVPPPPPEEVAVPINLVRFADRTTAPPAARSAPMPQQQAKEETKVEHSQNIPLPHRLPMPSAEIASPEAAAPDVMPVRKAPPDADVAVAVNKAKKYTPPPARPRQPPAPTDDLSRKLQALALLQQPSPPLKADPQRQNGAGISNATTGSANAAPGKSAAYSVKDFIRAQVERRWNLSGDMVQADDWRISIHITLRRDGSVTLAEIVDDPRLRTSRAFRDFAYSARDAVILSSPLAIPPGAYDIARDIVIDFDPRRVLQ